MKVVAFNGSARKNGNTAILAKTVLPVSVGEATQANQVPYIHISGGRFICKNYRDGMGFLLVVKRIYVFSTNYHLTR